jgi:GDP-L-fucose synthase
MSKKIYVAGHRGLVGSAIYRKLVNSDAEVVIAGRDELDLTNQSDVYQFFVQNKFDQVYLAAAKVGGIRANDNCSADFIMQNLMVQNNVFDAAFKTGVEKLLFLGSSCVYPKFSDQPISETMLLGGALEPTNEAYAIAKIAGIKCCQHLRKQYGLDYRVAMPTNLYGPGDNYHPEDSHVFASLIRKFSEAIKHAHPTLEVWGTGAALREFLHVDDLADACLFLLNIDEKEFYGVLDEGSSHINVGSGHEVSIRELVHMMMEHTKFSGSIKYLTQYPDGTPRKLMDSSNLRALGWKPKIQLNEGLAKTYNSYHERD